MKISGFTIIRNGTEFDYPYKESIRSLYPLVDELVINVGKSTDDTLAQIHALAQELGKEKIVIFESDWHLDDLEKKRSGQILSEQTNLALDRCKNDWCIYLQADEVLSEEDYRKIKYKIELASTDSNVEALVFNYLHFYGSFDVVQRSRSAYRREVRVVRKSSTAVSIGDAQSFKKKNGEKLNAIFSEANIYHYGWVRTPEAMKEKTYFMDQLYHGNPTEEQAKAHIPHSGDNYKYKRIIGLESFKGTHPKVMLDRIKNKNWHWDWQGTPLAFGLKDIKKVVLDRIEKSTGKRWFEYKSYRLIKEPMPRVSIMLSTFRMLKELEMVLESLARQTYKNFEVILCEDDESSETAALLRKFLERYPSLKIKHVFQKNSGFRKCRILNQGIVKAEGQLLVFLDGDCVVHPHFVEDNVSHYSPGYYLAGRRIDLGEEFTKKVGLSSIREGLFDGLNLQWILSRFQNQSDKLHRTIRVNHDGLRRLFNLDRVTDLKGCNFSVSKIDLLAINGFDESYEGYGREDTDVELRLQNLGLKIRSLRGVAIQFHLWHPRREFTAQNDSLLESVKKEKRVLALKGLSSLGSAS